MQFLKNFFIMHFNLLFIVRFTIFKNEEAILIQKFHLK